MGQALLKVVTETVSWHLVWLWLWFEIGVILYIAKRAYYLVTGPNPVASTYSQFIKRCWLPLFIRTTIDSVIFWVCFNPALASDGLNYLGWQKFSWVVGLLTQFAPVAFFFGHTVDSIMDVAVSKIPFLKNFLPQMPSPLAATPAQAEAKAQAKAEALA
jgi:hypothetical protein